MYGSSLRMETCRPRALRSRPILAAVMPLPSEEVTPPVTKTYFAMGLVLRGFFEWYRKDPDPARRRLHDPARTDGRRDLRGLAGDVDPRVRRREGGGRGVAGERCPGAVPARVRAGAAGRPGDGRPRGSIGHDRRR